MTTPLIDDKAIGIEVSWSFGYGDATAVMIPRQLVRDTLEDLGVPNVAMLVPAFSPNDALKRALRYASFPKDMQVKEFARPRKDSPRAIGVYYREAVDGESGDKWHCGARVRHQNGTIECLPPEGMNDFPNARARQNGDRVAAIANGAIANCMNIDLSDLLCEIGHGSRWISRRRNSGGVYFLPANTKRSRTRAEQFANILTALADLTSDRDRSNQFIPQVHELFGSRLTMDSWQGSALDAFAADIEQLEKELTRMNEDGVMRDKTKRQRADEAADIMDKANAYSHFLGKYVDTIASKLQAIQAQFIDAIEQNAAAADDAMNALPDDAPAAPKKKRGRKKKTPVTTKPTVEDLDNFFSNF